MNNDLLKVVELLDTISNQYHIKVYGNYLYVISPRFLQKKDTKDNIKFTVMALTHGNEIGGLFVLINILTDIANGNMVLTFTFGVVLGNILAFEKNKRFIDKDLNRCFAGKKVDCYEEKRAVEISKMLSMSDYFLDLHQTIEPSKTAFFIFPYTKKNFQFASVIGMSLPIVTHCGKGFSKDGMCTDEFVNSCGGVGISFESGQKGKDNKQNILTTSIVRQYIAVFNKDEDHYKDKPLSSAYTWQQIVLCPKMGSVQLKEGLINFSSIKKEDVIATINGKKILCIQDGYILFPKYNFTDEHRPAELCRIIGRVSIKKLTNINKIK
jgi:succinylglutamate desuccinylase